jgi:membrane-associated phospholipid phosphatase
MPRDVRNLVLASAACAFALVVVAAIAYELAPATELDVSLVKHLGLDEGAAGYGLASAVTSLANPLPFLAILGAIVTLGLIARRNRETVAALAVVAGANLSTQVLKHVFEHARWTMVLGWGNQPSPDSYPSGHTTAAASLAVALVLIAPPRWRPLAAAVGGAFTIAVGVGVVVIKVHYPSDVVGGLLVVASWTLAAIAALRLIRPRDPEAEREEGEPGSGRFAVGLQ